MIVKKPICVTLDEENIKKLEELKKEKKLTLSEVLDCIIENFILNQKQEVKKYDAICSTDSQKSNKVAIDGKIQRRANSNC
jgi:hypothetical protein